MGHILMQNCTYICSRHGHSGGPVQLWPTPPENNRMQFLLHCHPIVLMDDLAYVWETFHEIESSLDFFKNQRLDVCDFF